MNLVDTIRRARSQSRVMAFGRAADALLTALCAWLTTPPAEQQALDARVVAVFERSAGARTATHIAAVFSEAVATSRVRSAVASRLRLERIAQPSAWLVVAAAAALTHLALLAISPWTVRTMWLMPAGVVVVCAAAATRQFRRRRK